MALFSNSSTVWAAPGLHGPLVIRAEYHCLRKTFPTPATHTTALSLNSYRIYFLFYRKIF